jgi:hypothetical protein
MAWQAERLAIQAAKESDMPNQEQSRNGMPRKDKDRPSPDTGRLGKDGQASARGTGDSPDPADRSNDRPMAGDEKGMPLGSSSPSPQDYRGDGPAKVGVTSDNQPDLVAPSGVNERDHGAADDRPSAGGTLNFDDGTDMGHPRGKVTGAGRTWNDKNPSDAGELGAPGAGMSDRNGPSDPDAKRNR